jgi:hypothetical protein
VLRAMADALAFAAFSSEYIAHLIAARSRQLPEAAPLVLMRRQDVLELELPPADLSAYPDLSTCPEPSMGRVDGEAHAGIDEVEGNAHGDD